jgi:hypothetical protein
MNLSKASKIMIALTFISLPSIMLGGFVLLSVLTGGGIGQDLNLNEAQQALWRAGHAHAGVLAILGVVSQMLLDAAILPKAIKWFSRIANPVAVLLISLSFFGLAYLEEFKWSMYLGIILLVVALLIVAVGLLLNEPPVKVAKSPLKIKAKAKVKAKVKAKPKTKK